VLRTVRTCIWMRSALRMPLVSWKRVRRARRCRGSSTRSVTDRQMCCACICGVDEALELRVAHTRRCLCVSAGRVRRWPYSRRISINNSKPIILFIHHRLRLHSLCFVPYSARSCASRCRSISRTDLCILLITWRPIDQLLYYPCRTILPTHTPFLCSHTRSVHRRLRCWSIPFRCS
jgi:hypothetical protein